MWGGALLFKLQTSNIVLGKILKVKTSNCIGRDKEGWVSEGTFYTLRSKLDPVLDFSSNLDFISILDFKYLFRERRNSGLHWRTRNWGAGRREFYHRWHKPKRDWDLNIRSYEYEHLTQTNGPSQLITSELVNNWTYFQIQLGFQMEWNPLRQTIVTLNPRLIVCKTMRKKHFLQYHLNFREEPLLPRVGKFNR